VSRTRRPILENDSAQLILNYIASYHSRDGTPPTQEEIAQSCNMTRGYVCKLINRLVAEGHLVKDGRHWRGTDIPNREEVEMERRHTAMRADYKRRGL